MKFAIALAAIAMTGCASMEPLTPEQAAALMYMQRGYQAPQTVYQPVYVQPVQPQAPIWNTPAPRPRINCTTTNGGYSLYTTCQ